MRRTARRKQRAQKRARDWTRREFLAGTTAAGLAIGLPPWLVGCGDDDDSRPPATPTPLATPTPMPEGLREDCTLQFDLSLAPIEDPCLHVFNSQDDMVMLQPETAESRDHFRAENPMLQGVPDANLTHFAENVDLPADALQVFWVTGHSRDTGEDVLASVNIHVPTQVLAALAQTAALRGRPLVRTAKMRHYNLGAHLEDSRLAEEYPSINSFVTPFDVAKAIVFHQPEIINLNVDTGATVLELIESLGCQGSPDPNCEPLISTLAFRIANAWPATESGFTMLTGVQVPAWARLVPIMDGDRVVLDSRGNPAVSWDISEEIARTAAAAAATIRKLIFDDTQYEGRHWHPTDGVTTRTDAPSPRTFSFPTGSPPPLRVVGEHGQGTTVHGMQFTKIAVVDQGKRTVEVQLRNHFLRYISAFVQFANEAGDLPVTNRGQQDTERARFLQLLNANYTVLGVPLLGDSVALQTLRFDVPSEATKARLYFGSLGVGGDAFCPEALLGSIVTLTFNIGLPTLFLAAGVTASVVLQKSIENALNSGPIRQVLLIVALRTLALAGPNVANGIFGSANAGNPTAALISIGSAALTALLSTGELSGLAAMIGIAFLVGRTADFAGPIGLAFKALAVGSALSNIIQSVAEVLASPAIFTNTLSVQMTTRITIEKDPDNSTFPTRARRYEVTLTYDQASKLAHKMSGTIESGRRDPIVVTFDAVPSGGMVTIDVILKTDDDWIVGRSTDTAGRVGPFGPIANNPATAGAVTITIKELLIPLTQNTRYEQLRKLGYRQGRRVWLDDTAAPTATRADLCQGQENALCDLTAITISQRVGDLGYGYQAGGQGVTYCGEGVGGVMYRLQNVSVTANADSDFKELPCGYRSPAGIIYDRLGAADGRGRNFFVQPTPSGYLVKSVVLQSSTTFNINEPLAWGIFSEAMDSLAVHPMGYVVGVNRQSPVAPHGDSPASPRACGCGHGTKRGAVRGAEGRRRHAPRTAACTGGDHCLRRRDLRARERQQPRAGLRRLRQSGAALQERH